MAITKLAWSSAQTALAAASAPFAAAANVDQGPIVGGPTAPVVAMHPAETPVGSVSGPEALPPGGPIGVLPQADLGGGAKPYVP
jgi:hypothetical protein